MLKRVVDVAEVLALLAAAFTVVMLFAASGGDGGSPSGGEGSGGEAADGEATYVSSCAGCHGAGGQGGLGPQLADGAVVAAFPDEADQVEVVAEGRGGMPGFGDRLSPEQVAAVVAFTREDL